MDWLRKMFLKIAEHWIKSLVVTLLPTSSVVLEYYTKVKPFSRWFIPFLKWRWSGWISFGFLLISIGFYWLWRTKIRAQIEEENIPESPKYFAAYNQRTVERKYAGVVWKIFLASNESPYTTTLRREDVFVWLYRNPYCPECDFALEKTLSKWHCVPCNVDYSIPRDLRERTWKKMRRVFERYVAQWGGGSFGIAEEPVKSFRRIAEGLDEKN